MPSVPPGGAGRDHTPRDHLGQSASNLRPHSAQRPQAPSRYFQGTYPAPPRAPGPMSSSTHGWFPIKTRQCACRCFLLFKPPAPSGESANTSVAEVRPHFQAARCGCSGKLQTQTEKPEEAAQRAQGPAMEPWPRLESGPLTL